MANYRFDEDGNILPPEPKTISEINEYIKCLIDEEILLQDLYVVGEVSNFKRHTTGHCYFSLKDEKSEIRAIMFSSSAKKLKFMPENGIKVLVQARVGVYPQGGVYQLYVSDMQPDGVGSLYLALEQLKQKLQNEGLFDENNKKLIPKYPKKIGVITSPTGAAIRDIIKVSSRRNPFVNLVLYPTLVQGPEAPRELTKAIEYFNIVNSVDVIIIGRGGGSIEDLWAFNDENLARAIYKSRIPVISGVGHEIDFTICDFVSDVRAATPSAAAEIATPDIYEIKNNLDVINYRILNSFTSTLKNYREILSSYEKNKIFLRPASMLDIPKIRLTSMIEKLSNGMKSRQYCDKERFAEINAKLFSLNPMAVLSRGYGAVYKDDKTVVKSVDEVALGNEILIKMSDGSINAKVVSKERKNG